jgi:DNA-directed RNA polymerase subunit RPC12/RpoP
MQQEVILKEQELELLPPKTRYECSDCHKTFTHIEHCKDNKDRCKKCKRKQITNKFYNPLYDKKIGFIGKFNINSQEYKMLISKYLKQGYSYYSAKSKVNYDLKCMQNNKFKKVIEAKNLEVKKESDKQLNKQFLEGLGQCKKK